MEPSHPLSLYRRACESLLGLRKEVPFKNTVVMDTMVRWYNYCTEQLSLTKEISKRYI